MKLIPSVLPFSRSRLVRSGNLSNVVVRTSGFAAVGLFCFLSASRAWSADCVSPPAGLVAWWTGDGNANEVVANRNGTLVAGVSFQSGMVGQAFAFDGSSQYVEIPGSEDLPFTTNITMEAWIKTDTILSFCAPIIAKGDTEWRMQTAGTSPYLNIGLNRSGGGGLVSGINGTRNIVDGHWHHVAAVYDGSTAYLYVDGTVDVSGPASGVIGQNSYPVRIGGNAEQDRRWSGLIDEVSIYATALSSNQIAAIYAARAAGKCIFLRISAQPLSQVGYWGKSATFSVVAQTAALPLSYQWQKDSVPIAGATDASLVLTNLQATNAGVYTVVVSDQSTNVVTSAPANLTVNPAGVSIAVYPGLTIDGVVGQIYGIQSTTDLNNTNSWSGVTNLTLALPVELWYDSQPVTQPTRYYRVVAGPISIP